ncbi:MAG: precorrin-8X methylmutase [Methanomicrobiales archaeon]|nr:precorrin-8X methylmutase [Methanomicrobiales archaeon]
MKRQSSRQGDTTGNTHIDHGALTREAREISRESRIIARESLGNQTLEDRIRQRCSIAVGDFSMAELLRFLHDPIPSGIKALSHGSPNLTDLRMVAVGIQKNGQHRPILCALDFGTELAFSQGITRTSAGFIALRETLADSIVVIGNAPSALLSLCAMVEERVIPALVIGTPVGFVNANESKKLLRTLPLPSISTEGTRGGTPVAVAAMNELIEIFCERRDD